MDVINVSHLSKQFSQFNAVTDLSFTVQEADVYGFLGQNGAGKSTTIRMLLTLITPSSGEIELFGMNLRTHRKEILRQVGAVIERPDLYKYLSAYENLSLFARMSGIRVQRKQLMEQLEMVGLAERASSKVKTYSQGMKQRLGIAIALIHNPQLVILDEPVNGLDPQGIADMRNLIMHLSRHLKKTVMVSSHLLNEMEQIATRMLIIDKGKKIIEGSVQELFDPAKTVVEVEVEDLAAATQAMQQSRWAGYLQNNNSQQLVLQLHKNQLAALNADMVAMGIGITAFKPGNSLEKYFLSLTGTNQHVAAFTN
ncbi:MAG TPA: ABC transporter ATP-binding protein [Chitinophagaceae bacterium]|nr:ABC transporter ATP-binding protein [Chitinophagaceae bacterium]